MESANVEKVYVEEKKHDYAKKSVGNTALGQ